MLNEISQIEKDKYRMNHFYVESTLKKKSSQKQGIESGCQGLGLGGIGRVWSKV